MFIHPIYHHQGILWYLSLDDIWLPSAAHWSNYRGPVEALGTRKQTFDLWFSSHSNASAASVSVCIPFSSYYQRVGWSDVPLSWFRIFAWSWDLLICPSLEKCLFWSGFCKVLFLPSGCKQQNLLWWNVLRLCMREKWCIWVWHLPQKVYKCQMQISMLQPRDDHQTEQQLFYK